jgi:hypothetical protein
MALFVFSRKLALLQLLADSQIHDFFHVNQLKKLRKNKYCSSHSAPTSTKVPLSIGEYAVVVPQWLIHWENMSPDDVTWEDASFIQSTFPQFQP